MSWFQTYTRIAFQMHAALEQSGDMYFVDTFYGPDPWRVSLPPEDLRQTLREIDELRASVPAITGSETRQEFLRVNLRTLETLCQYLSGEPMTLLEAARGLLDIEVKPIPEARLEEYRRKIEEALGGTGTLAERFARFYSHLRVQPADDQHLLSLFQDAIVEARARTRAILPLPGAEAVDLSVVRNVYAGASNWYKGNYRSAMEINGDRPTTLLRLLLLACHEGYPGHHTESTLKEEMLYRGRVCTEQCLFFNGPQVVIAEGIATLAAPMIFPPAEAARWLEDGYRELGHPLDGANLSLLLEAFWSLDPDALGTNLLLRVEDGASLEDAIAYGARYVLDSEDQVRDNVTRLYNAPLLPRVYQLSYYHGRHLMEPLLQGDDRHDVWRSFLTEQWTPGMLRSQTQKG